MTKEGIDIFNLNYDRDHYNYKEIRPGLFCEANQKGFINIRERILEMLNYAGAVKAVAVANQHFSGNIYGVYAVLDRMVELGELKEITSSKGINVGDRVFIKAKEME